MQTTPPMPFIDDGYTRDEVIAAAKRHPEVRIVYRPMLAPERRRLTLQTVRLNARGEGGIDSASQLVIAAVAALEPNLFEKIYAAVAGFDDAGFDNRSHEEATNAKN